MDKESIKNILEKAVRAPSGDNSQPWRFRVNDGVVRIFNLPEIDNPFYNYEQRASFIAHGALIENIVILAATAGYESKVHLLPADGQENHAVADIFFEYNSKIADPLADYIDKRCSNRRMYKNQPLPDSVVLDFVSVAKDISSDLDVSVITNDEKIKTLAQAVSMNERVVLENKDLHRIFYGDLVWTDEEERQKKSGLFVKTLELSPPQKIGFKLFKYWPILKFLVKIGFSKFVAKENAKIYGSASGYVAVMVNDNIPRNFIIAGRLFERLWLKITKAGLSAQPTTGILFLVQRVMAKKTKGLSTESVKLISDVYDIIKSVFGLTHETVAMLIRIGYAEKPSATTSRRPPVYV